MEWIIVSLIAAALVMDTSAAFQVLISQPLIACTAIGLFLNEPALGLQMGLLTQLLWVGNLPVGAAVVPAGNPASVIAAIVVIKLKEEIPDLNYILILAALVYGLILSYLGSKIVKQNRKWNVWFFNKAVMLVEKGRGDKIGYLNWSALFLQFALAFCTILFASYAGVQVAAPILRKIPPDWDLVAKYIQFAAVGSGAGFVLSYYKNTKDLKWLALGLIAAVIVVISL